MSGSPKKQPKPLVLPVLNRPDSRAEFAAFYGVSLPSVNRWLKAKTISRIKVGRRVFIDRALAVSELAAKYTIRSIGGKQGRVI